MKKILQYLKIVLCGIVFGVANVIPGVSGGTMLVVFGMYDRLTESISGIKAIFKNIVFLIFFGIGAGAGILGFAKLIKFLFDNYEVQTNMYFIGLILGSVPLIYRMGTAESKVKPLCSVPFVISLWIVIALTVMQNLMGNTEQVAEQVAGFDPLMSVKLLVFAFVAAVAMIIPGLSGSFVMLLLGVYQTVISAIQINDLNFYVIIPFAIGVVLGIILGAKIISTLMKKFRLMAYSAIMGLVVGSVYSILPSGFGFNLSTGYGFVCLLFGVLTSILVEKLGENSENETA
jgi:putative membrane protein